MDFVNAGKLDEEIKRRQAEWERVRKKEDPIEAPPEVFDNRTLYDKLKEQHDIKKKEFEDSHSLKNQIRGVDQDEAEFLNEIDHVRVERERQLRNEEKKELDEVKAALQAKSAVELSNVPTIKVNLPIHKKENKQADLLAHAIVSKRKLSAITSAEINLSDKKNDESTTEPKRSKETTNSNQIMVGILPGLGVYDSDSSSNSDTSDEDV